MGALRKAGGNWVEGDRFFDREAEIEALAERVRDGVHTLLTAQRRMGKTSLVREVLRRLKEGGSFETIFVDLEGASSPADAIAEIGFRSEAAQGAWKRIKSLFANVLPAEVEVGGQVPALAGADLRVKLRAGVDAGNWRQKGDEVFAALAGNERPVALAIDELPILVNRLLKGDDYRITPERRRAADEFLSWLRKNGQTHRDQICMILSGSVSLEPILQQAGLSAHANIFASFDLKPWDRETAMACLGALGETYRIDLPLDVRREMCRRLRCQVPHHVQRFFDVLHEDLRRAGRRAASLEDVERVYDREMLGIRGQTDLPHYEDRLRMVLGVDGYRVALEMLTEAANNRGRLPGDAVRRYGESLADEARVRREVRRGLDREVRQRESLAGETPADPPLVEDVLHVLEHDGYLARQGDGYRFVSGLLEDWWRVRYGRSGASSASPGAGPARSAKR